MEVRQGLTVEECSSQCHCSMRWPLLTELVPCRSLLGTLRCVHTELPSHLTVPLLLAVGDAS